MSHVLVIGSGGREHALAWKLSQSPRVTRVSVAPGNDGFPGEWQRWPLKNAASSTREGFEELAARAKKENVSLVVVGPDNPLADGIVDVLTREGLLAFGPTQAAAQLEASKAFAKEIMTAAKVPTARYGVVRSEADARDFFERHGWGQGWVVKADGLALGKGVRVCASLDEALASVKDLLPISGSLVIEEKLHGEEISWMAFCDGKQAALLDPARDFKRVRDQDQGPNTGGMGAFSPVPGIPAGFRERVQREVFEPVLQEMNRRNTPFHGVLYAGLMVDFSSDRYWVLEFNARFGDPETQVLLPRLDGDFYQWCRASARGELSQLPSQVPFSHQSAVVVIGAAEGYPEHVKTGAEIQAAVLLQAPQYFLAGLKRTADAPSAPLQVSGGRVLGALGLGTDLSQARAQAYERLKHVRFSGMHFRTDIAEKAAKQAAEEKPSC